MDHAAVLALFDRDMREGARPDGPGARVERTGNVVRQISSAHGWNGVVWSGLDETDADAAIAEQIAYFAGQGWIPLWIERPHQCAASVRIRCTA